MLSSLPIRKWTTKQGDSLPARSASKHHLNILNSISNKQETWFNHDKHARDVYSLPFICLLLSIFKLNLPENLLWSWGPHPPSKSQHLSSTASGTTLLRHEKACSGWQLFSPPSMKATKAQNTLSTTNPKKIQTEQKLSLVADWALRQCLIVEMLQSLWQTIKDAGCVGYMLETR